MRWGVIKGDELTCAQWLSSNMPTSSQDRWRSRPARLSESSEGTSSEQYVCRFLPTNSPARLVAATTVSPEQATQNILAQQRVHRPVSPHLSIYKAQITWYVSILHRITGLVLSGGFYVFGTAYLVAPYLGWHLESATIAAAFASWPFVAKVLTKFTLALPFAFHSYNGVRHLIWDTTSMMSNAKVNASGWTVVGLSVASALALAFV